MFIIKKRNPISVIVLMIITLGIYGVYWVVKTKGEINSLGARIPTAWLFIIPIVNIYFVYKYAEGFSRYVKKDSHPLIWFLLYMLLFPVAIVLFQVGLNKVANNKQQDGSFNTTETTRRIITMFVLINLTLHPFIASASAIDYWRDDQKSYEYCSSFIPIAGGLVGGLIFPPLAVLGVELGVIGCDIFHKKFDWVGTADRATGRVFANPTSLATVVTPAIPLAYSGYKLAVGGVELMAEGTGQIIAEGSRTATVGRTNATSSESLNTSPSTTTSGQLIQESTKAISPASKTQAQQGIVKAVVISPDGQPVYQAKFWLVDSQGRVVNKSTGGIAYDSVRNTTETGYLETIPVPNGLYILNITCAANCMFGDKFAQNIVDDIYAKWSKEVEVDINKSQIDLGRVVVKKWTKVTFAVVDSVGQRSPFLKVQIMDSEGRDAAASTLNQFAIGYYSVSLPDGTYTIKMDESYYKVVEKVFSVNSSSLDLGTFIMEKR